MTEQLILPLFDVEPVAPSSHTIPTVGTEFTRRVVNTVKDLEKYKVDIEAALSYAHNSHTFDNIVAMVLTETVDFYPLQNSFIIMELHRYPEHNVYHGFLAGGSWEEIMEQQPMIMEEAKKRDAKYLSIAGRHGWTKVMKRYGWTHQYSSVYKEVE